jgi:hypothetical protein
LREEKHVTTISDKILWGLYKSPVGIDDKTHGMKCIKTDTNRKDNIQMRNFQVQSDQVRNGIPALRKEHQVFEVYQQPEIQDNADDQQQPLFIPARFLYNFMCKVKINQWSNEHDENKFNPPEAVKNQARDKDQPKPAPLWQCPIQGNNNQ